MLVEGIPVEVSSDRGPTGTLGIQGDFSESL